MIKNYAAHMEAICNSNSQNNKLDNHKFQTDQIVETMHYLLFSKEV